MKTRMLRVWGKGEDEHAAVYKGFYIDDDINNAASMASIAGPVCRHGLIFDTVKACIVLFAQDVTSLDDPRPTDIVIDPNNDVVVKLREKDKKLNYSDSLVVVKVLNAWSSDPQHANPPGRDAPCHVWAFGKRDMTEKEKRALTKIPRGPQTEVKSGLRYNKKLDEYFSGLFRRELLPLVDVVKELDRKVKAAAAKKVVSVSSAPQYVFRREGESWAMAFEGSKVFHTQPRKGYEYIRELLAHPNHEYTAPELTGVVNKLLPANAAFQDGKDKLEGTVETQQFKMDKKAIAQTLKRLDELRSELNTPTNSEGENREIKDEIEKLEAHIKSCTFHGRTKAFSTQDDKERVRITKLIQKARKAIGKSLPKLETHLRSIKTGHRFVYTGNLPFAL